MQYWTIITELNSDNVIVIDMRQRQLLDKITSDYVLDKAYQWLCDTRKDAGVNNSIWDLRFNWKEMKLELIRELRNNIYHLSPLRRYMIEGQAVDCWDALVLKAVAIILSEMLSVDIPSCCTNVKGHGGCKRAVREVWDKLNDYKFVYKSDVKSYYASIDHDILLSRLKEITTDEVVLRLVSEYCNRLVWIDGEYSLITRGISLGCPLSPEKLLRPLNKCFPG